MANAHKNKIVFNGTILIDLTADTVVPSALASGYTAHDASGAIITGTAQMGGAVITEQQDSHGGTVKVITTDGSIDLSSDTVDAAHLLSGYTAHDKAGTAITGSYVAPTFETQAKTATPTESQQAVTPDSGYDGLSSVTVEAVSSTYIGSDITRRSGSDLTASGATVAVPAGYYEQSASKSIASGSATTPSTRIFTYPTISVGSDGLITATVSDSISVTPTVSAGYVSSGTAGTVSVSGSDTLQLSTQAATTVTPSTSQQTAVVAGKYTTGNVVVSAMPSGTAGTPTAMKGSVSNHSINVTPSVTNTTGYITGDTKTGTAVTVSASELVSGSQTITENDTYDVTNLASVVVNVASSGGGIGTLLNTTSIGSVSTSSTQAASLNVSLSVQGVNGYDLLIVESSVNTTTNNRHVSTVGVILLTGSSNAATTKNGATIATAKWNSKLSSSGVMTSSTSTTAYGIYPNSCTVSNGTATIPMYRRYNSTSTGTINGTYTARVYGVSLVDLIGG